MKPNTFAGLSIVNTEEAMPTTKRQLQAKLEGIEKLRDDYSSMLDQEFESLRVKSK